MQLVMETKKSWIKVTTMKLATVNLITVPLGKNGLKKRKHEENYLSCVDAGKCIKRIKKC